MRVPLEAANELAVGHIPELREAISRARSNLLAVGGKRQAIDGVAVRLFERQNGLAVLDVEQLDLAAARRLAAADGQCLPIRREVERRYAVGEDAVGFRRADRSLELPLRRQFNHQSILLATSDDFSLS